MSWLSDLIEQFGVSRAFVGAIFVSTGLLVLGQYLGIDSFPEVPIQWRWAVFGLCLFSFSYLIFWVVPFLSKSFFGYLKSVWCNPKVTSLSHLEKDLLVHLGLNSPNQYINIEQVVSSPGERLEVISACSSLKRRGFLNVGIDGNLVGLTSRGRGYALKIYRKDQSGAD